MNPSNLPEPQRIREAIKAGILIGFATGAALGAFVVAVTWLICTI